MHFEKPLDYPQDKKCFQQMSQNYKRPDMFASDFFKKVAFIQMKVQSKR